MPTQRQQELLALRAAYVTAHHEFGLSWGEISRRFRVPERTTSTTYNRACERAQPTDLLEILKHLGDQSHSGRKQHFSRRI